MVLSRIVGYDVPAPAGLDVAQHAILETDSCEIGKGHVALVSKANVLIDAQILQPRSGREASMK
jgi:hypothetical protein